MTSDTFLATTARVLAERRASYGPADVAMEAIAARWSVTLGRPVSPTQVVLCLIDLKLARLSRNPSHEDSLIHVAGYAALLAEVAR